MDQNKRLRQLVKYLTHTGKKTLKTELVDELVNLCGLHDGYLKQVCDLLHEALKEYHSEVRYSVIQLVDVFFMKFKDFRKMYLNDLGNVMKLTLAVNTKETLPPPESTAKELSKLFLQVFHNWFVQFEFDDERIPWSYDFLEQHVHVDFSTFEIVNPEEKKMKEEAHRMEVAIRKEQLSRMTSEVEGIKADIESNATALETCFSLLFPDLSEEANGSNEGEIDMRLYGIVDPQHTVEVNVDLINNKILLVEDNENSPVIENARGSFKIINNKHLPKIKAWEEVIKKADGESALLEECVKLRLRLELLVTKYNKLDIRKPPKKEKEESDGGDEVSSDSELEEVAPPTKKKKAPRLVEWNFLDAPPSKEMDEPKPSTSKVKVLNMSERKKELLKIAPKLPYDIDLYHWEDETLSAPKVVLSNAQGEMFWAAQPEGLEELEMPEGSAALRRRVIEFTGKFEPVTRPCGARLPSGKLCPRFDRYKCPLHGLIVERDEKGNVVNPEDEKKVAKSKPKPSVPDWQDPVLLAQLKAQTGLDLKMPEKGKRLKRKKYPGLTDIDLCQEPTAKDRIAKKIFNKSSMRRVASSMDRFDQKRHRDKFGDQFNYF